MHVAVVWLSAAKTNTCLKDIHVPVSNVYKQLAFICLIYLYLLYCICVQVCVNLHECIILRNTAVELQVCMLEVCIKELALCMNRKNILDEKMTVKRF